MSHETPIQTPVESSEPTDGRLRRFIRKPIGKAAVAATATLIAAGAVLGISVHNNDVADARAQAQGAIAKTHDEQQKAFAEQQKAAEAIAQRFECTLEQATDMQQVPPPLVAQDELHRTSVLLEVGITPAEQAQPYLNAYSESNAVEWDNPAVRAYVNITDPKTGKVDGNHFNMQMASTGGLDQEGEYADGYSTKLNNTVYPFTRYAAGTTATVSVQQAVHTIDPQGNAHITTGEVNCGTIEFNGQTWQLTTQMPPENPPLVEQVIPAYHDDSH